MLAGNDALPPNKEITITQPLKKPIGIYITIRNKNKFCATRWIMHGTRALNADGKRNKLMYLRTYAFLRCRHRWLQENNEQSNREIGD